MPAAAKTKGVTYVDFEAPLFVHPELEGLQFSVLRRTFKGRVNDAGSWVLPKLNVAKAFNSGARGVRTEVLLPAEAPDLYQDPAELCRLFEAQACELQKDLVIHCKLLVTGSRPLHSWYEAARLFAMRHLVDDEALAVVVVLHNPTASGFHSANEPHIHLMALARSLGSRGFGPTTRLATDDARFPLATAWGEIRQEAGL